VALAAQVVACALSFGLAAVLKRAGFGGFGLPVILGVEGVIAAILSLRWGLARWWIPLQLVLPLTAGTALMLDLPSWVFLAAFAALALVFWNASSDRVPLYLTNRTTWRALVDLLPEKPGARFLDVGSGIGGTMLFLAARRPDMTFTGIESAPLPFALAWLRLKLAGLPNVRLHYGDFWNHDLGTAEVVYCFLSPEPMPKLFDKATREMRPGSLFISNSFAVNRPGIAGGCLV